MNDNEIADRIKLGHSRILQTPTYYKPTFMEVSKAAYEVFTGRKYRRALYKDRLKSSMRKQKMITGIRHKKNRLITFLINLFNKKTDNSIVEVSGGYNAIWAIALILLFAFLRG